MADKRAVKLEYGRGGKTFNGVVTDPEGGQRSFAGLPYDRMMWMVHEELEAHPEARLEIERYEAAYPMSMAPELVDLLRTDFEEAMRRLNPPAQRVVVGGARRTVTMGLRHGVDTLADAFGERVYLSRRAGQVESPFTGRWEPEGPYEALGLVTESATWATIPVYDLLASECDRFWLPRRWNRHKGWIGKGELQDMLDTYRKETANVPG